MHFINGSRARGTRQNEGDRNNESLPLRIQGDADKIPPDQAVRWPPVSARDFPGFSELSAPLLRSGTRCVTTDMALERKRLRRGQRNYLWSTSLLAVTLTALMTASAAADELDDFIAKEMQAQSIPGVAIAVVQRDRMLVRRDYGLANLETDSPV